MMSGYPPPGPPPYFCSYPPPPPPPQVPPGSFTYFPQPYPYQPPHWQPPYPQPPYSQPYIQPPILAPSTQTDYDVNVFEQPTSVAVPEPDPLPAPVQDIISWVPATPTTAQELEYKAVVGGKEGYDGSPLWVIRAHHKGELIPGKLAISHRYAFIPSAGQEVPVHNLEVLCSKPGGVKWFSAKNGQVPERAVVAGNTLNAEPLYIGRVSHKSSLTPGKIQPSHGCCYISYGGNEISFRKYEVLCEVL